jgi:effector-binding domain-containing protein
MKVEVVERPELYAHSTHIGPYTGLGEAWGHLRNE